MDLQICPVHSCTSETKPVARKASTNNLLHETDGFCFRSNHGALALKHVTSASFATTTKYYYYYYYYSSSYYENYYYYYYYYYYDDDDDDDYYYYYYYCYYYLLLACMTCLGCILHLLLRCTNFSICKVP